MGRGTEVRRDPNITQSSIGSSENRRNASAMRSLRDLVGCSRYLAIVGGKLFPGLLAGAQPRQVVAVPFVPFVPFAWDVR